MNTSTYDFVSVEMRGLKAALVARAQAQRVSVSELVRSAVARDLGLLVVNGETQSEEVPQGAEHTAYVKLSIRMTAEEHRAYVDYLNLVRQMEDMERQHIYFRGHTDTVAYLKKIKAI